MKYPEIAKRFAYILNLRHLKQVDLVNKTGISKASINQYVKGIHCPENDRAMILSKELKVNPMWLMGFDVPMEEETVEKNTVNWNKTINGQETKLVPLNSHAAKLVENFDRLSPSQQTLVDNLIETLVSKL